MRLLDASIIAVRKDADGQDYPEGCWDIRISGLIHSEPFNVRGLCNTLSSQAGAEIIDDGSGRQLRIMTQSDLEYTLRNLQRLLKYALRDDNIAIRYESMVLMPDGRIENIKKAGVELGNMQYADWVAQQTDILNIEAYVYRLGSPLSIVIAKGLTSIQARNLNTHVTDSKGRGAWFFQSNDQSIVQTPDVNDTMSRMHAALRLMVPDKHIVVRYTYMGAPEHIYVITPDGNVERLRTYLPGQIIGKVQDAMQPVKA